MIVCIFLYVYVEEFASYLKYTRQLDFYEAPNYDYLRQLFASVMARNDWSFDWVFDWSTRSQVSIYCVLALTCVFICIAFYGIYITISYYLLLYIFELGKSVV